MDNNQLSLMADLAQLLNFSMNVQEVTNDEIFKHLLHQDKILDEQTQMYLCKLTQQNEEILRLLHQIIDILKNL